MEDRCTELMGIGCERRGGVIGLDSKVITALFFARLKSVVVFYNFDLNVFLTYKIWINGVHFIHREILFSAVVLFSWELFLKNYYTQVVLLKSLKSVSLFQTGPSSTLEIKFQVSRCEIMSRIYLMSGIIFSLVQTLSNYPLGS